MRAMTEIEWLDGRVTKVPELALGDALGESVQAELDFGFDDVLEGLWVEVRHHEPDEDSDGDPRGRGCALYADCRYSLVEPSDLDRVFCILYEGQPRVQPRRGGAREPFAGLRVAYYIKATELRDRFQKAVQRGNTSRVVSSLVKPSCLIVDEVGRCVYDRPCTDLFFDVVDRRYEKEGPNAMVLTSNIAPSGWDEFFTGDNTLLCALDRLFDKASVFVMRGPSYRGRGLDTYSVEAVPQAVKVRGIQPEGM